MESNCIVKNIFYLAKTKITNRNRTNEVISYTGDTENEWKRRYNGKSLSFNHRNYKNATTLSACFWTIKREVMKSKIRKFLKRVKTSVIGIDYV